MSYLTFSQQLTFHPDTCLYRSHLAFCDRVLQALDSLISHVHLHNEAIQDCRTDLDVHCSKLWRLVSVCISDRLPSYLTALETSSRRAMQECDG